MDPMIKLKNILCGLSRGKSVLVLYDAFKYPSKSLQQEIIRAKKVADYSKSKLEIYSQNKDAIILDENITHTDKSLDDILILLREKYNRVSLLSINTEKILIENRLIVKESINSNILKIKELLFTECRELDAITVANKIREKAGLELINQVAIILDPIRDSYIKGELYSIGNIVSDKDNSLYEITKLGTNYLCVVDSQGKRSRKWLKDISIAEHNPGVSMKSFKDYIEESTVERIDKKSTYNVAKDILDKEEFKILKKIQETKPVKESFSDDEEISEQDITDMIDSVSEDDILSIIEDVDLALIYDDGEFFDELSESEDINEVLSREERIKSKTRFKRTESKRERSIKLALKKHSTFFINII